tara:strand:+ start:3661 stop:4017 length:357 start_codon:yes stop_codon:yes gene_type:complete
MEDLKLSDEVIGHIAKVLQLALLTGTDVVDNLRMLRLQNEDGVLNVHPLSQEIFEKSIHEMIADVEVLRMKKIHLEETGEEMTDEAAAGFVEAASEQTQELPNILNLGKDISGDVDEW